MLNLNKKKKIEIIQNLDAGFKCFIHKATAKIVAYPDFEGFEEITGEMADPEQKIVESSPEDYFELIEMDSKQVYSTMKEFAENVDDPITKLKLLDALSAYKPFANFRAKIDRSGEYRKEWFDFKESKYYEWIEEQLENINE
jgi:hypothetical protein